MRDGPMSRIGGASARASGALMVSGFGSGNGTSDFLVVSFLLLESARIGIGIATVSRPAGGRLRRPPAVSTRVRTVSRRPLTVSRRTGTCAPTPAGKTAPATAPRPRRAIHSDRRRITRRVLERTRRRCRRERRLGRAESFRGRTPCTRYPPRRDAPMESRRRIPQGRAPR